MVPTALGWPRVAAASLTMVSTRRASTALAWLVGGAFVALGLVEVVLRLVASDGVDLTAIVFWFLTLCGGGSLVLIGCFALPTRRGLANVLVIAGCVLGVLAAAWTVVLPILAFVLIFLRLRNDGSQQLGSRS